jgi:acyl-CoA synthetase (AMP-forming)/AMP-acid ligase II
VIHRGPYPDIEVPDLPLADLVLRKARELGSKPAFIDEASGRILTFSELAESIARVSSGLVRRGFAKGDVLAICTPNALEFPIVFHAVARAGGIVTPVNPLSTAEEIRKQLVDSGARFVLASAHLADKVREASAGTRVEEIFVAVANGETGATGATGDPCDLTPFSALFDRSGDARMPPIDPREDVVALPYSSGTTGLPKGVMLTHRNLVANVLQLDVGHMRADDVLICVLPMFHIYGMSAIVNQGLRLGCTTVVMPRCDVTQLVEALARHRVTFAHLVPPILLEIAKNPLLARVDLEHVRVMFSGAAPLSSELSGAVAQRVGCEVVQGYGMTEASPATHMTPARPHAAKHGSVGTCLANTECRIVDPESGRDLPAGEPGELWVRGPQVMKGYLNNPEATRATVDDEGWLHTGDIARVDADGHFFIVDRVKELIKYKGWQIAPAELEAILLTHPSVADAAVIGVPDDEAGELPKVFVVRRGEVSAEEILAFVAARVAPYKKVRALEFIDKIPKSPSGKILRRLLAARRPAGE